MEKCKKIITPCDANKINEIINENDENKTICFREGVYKFDDGNNIFIKKSINLVALEKGKVVLDGNNNGSVITIADENAEVLLKGFVLKNGNAKHGGGVFIADSKSVIIEDCSIIQNKGRDEGGGIYIHIGQLIVKRTRIMENKSKYAGSAIMVNGPVQLEIEDSLICKNTTQQGSSIDIRENSEVNIIRSTIADNTGGYEIEVSFISSIFIKDSIVYGKNAIQNFNDKKTNVKVENSIIYGNTKNLELLKGVKQVDPLFIKEGEDRYKLSDNSPAKNMLKSSNEKDLQGNPRKTQGAIGAFDN